MLQTLWFLIEAGIERMFVTSLHWQAPWEVHLACTQGLVSGYFIVSFLFFSLSAYRCALMIICDCMLWFHYLLLLLLYVGAPLWPLLWSPSRASLPLQEQRCSLWNSPPLQGVFLPLSGWKPMGAHVGGQDAAGQCLSKVTVHSHHSGFTLFSRLLF